VNIATKLPKVPDFPMELPDLPAPPEIPGLPASPGAELRRYVTGVEVIPLTGAAPAAPPVAARANRKLVPFVYE